MSEHDSVLFNVDINNYNGVVEIVLVAPSSSY